MHNGLAWLARRRPRRGSTARSLRPRGRRAPRHRRGPRVPRCLPDRRPPAPGRSAWPGPARETAVGPRQAEARARPHRRRATNRRATDWCRRWVRPPAAQGPVAQRQAARESPARIAGRVSPRRDRGQRRPAAAEAHCARRPEPLLGASSSESGSIAEGAAVILPASALGVEAVVSSIRPLTLRKALEISFGCGWKYSAST